jgi:hypothetical protein
MVAYIFGAGASANANYPLASGLLHELSNWLDNQNTLEDHIEGFRNRFVQLRTLFATLDDFEAILERLRLMGIPARSVETLTSFGIWGHL